MKTKCYCPVCRKAFYWNGKVAMLTPKHKNPMGDPCEGEKRVLKLDSLAMKASKSK